MVAVPEQSLLQNDGSVRGASTREWVERWLSPDRLAPYLANCGGDVERALELYEWNIALGQVLMRDISHFEVALRNAYDRVMCESWNGDAHWLLDDASPVRRPVMRKSERGELDANRINRKAIDAVVGRLPGDATPGSIVSNLTLGFWVHLSDRSREAVIWRTALYRAWPKGTNRRELQPRLDGILRVRNRVAHAERLFNPSDEKLSPLVVDADVVNLLRALCSEAAERLYGECEGSPAELFCQEHPAPADVRL